MVLSKDLKIAICFGLIMGAILSLCNLCFASTETELSFDYERGLIIDYSGIIQSNTEENYLYYVLLEKGKTYKYVPIGNHTGAFYQDISVGSVGIDKEIFTSSNEYVFTPSDDVYLTFAVWGASSGVGRIYLVEEGMSSFIDTLAYSLSVNGFWNTVLACVPLIAISVLFGFALWSIARLIIGIIKLRGGM